MVYIYKIHTKGSIMVNSTDFNRMGPSVHWGRANVSARFHQNAYNKALRTPLACDSVFFMQPMMPPPQPHISGFGKFLMTFNSALGGFFGGFSLTSGQGNNMPMSCRLPGMPMPGMGMPGMGMPGMPWMNGGNFLC